ncbi:MAG: hypothetical protein U9R14_02370 [Patescibacteria group bacterium]|nr:hypothetical protein [Patescibacteria group bacterium]
MFNNIINAIRGDQDKRRIILWIVIILILILLLIAMINSLFYSNTQGFGRLSNWLDLTKYQAVFLSNGQVYFGKATDVNSQTLVLEDIYYLRVARDLQAGSAGEQTNTDNFSLIKLGNEIHGPEDKMSINLDHILFVEDLKDNSKVVEGIRAYRAAR